MAHGGQVAGGARHEKHQCGTGRHAFGHHGCGHGHRRSRADVEGQGDGQGEARNVSLGLQSFKNGGGHVEGDCGGRNDSENQLTPNTADEIESVVDHFRETSAPFGATHAF